MISEEGARTQNGFLNKRLVFLKIEPILEAFLALVFFSFDFCASRLRAGDWERAGKALTIRERFLNAFTLAFGALLAEAVAVAAAIGRMAFGAACGSAATNDDEWLVFSGAVRCVKT